MVSTALFAAYYTCNKVQYLVIRLSTQKTCGVSSYLYLRCVLQLPSTDEEERMEIEDLGELTLWYSSQYLKAKMYAISSDTYQLQLIKLHDFKLERFKSL